MIHAHLFEKWIWNIKNTKKIKKNAIAAGEPVSRETWLALRSKTHFTMVLDIIVLFKTSGTVCFCQLTKFSIKLTNLINKLYNGACLGT